MDITAYIASGILELYVAGALSDQENREVYRLMQQHPEIQKEVEQIEAAIKKLTAAAAPNTTADLFEPIKTRVQNQSANRESIPKVISIVKPKYNWITYTGWAAAFIIGAGLLWTLNQTNNLKSNLTTAEIENAYLEEQIANAKTDLAASKNLLNILRDKDIISVPLGGQGEFANTYAKVYWNKKDNSIYLDAQGLPEAPAGKVYQVWSLKLNPLTPTSLGTIDNFNSDDNKIFAIANANESEAFGITLEPEGGSETPTMDQLYTLGVVVAAAP
ncbi:anti-sigma-K factor rskA [Gelidibacter sediminis]|uniref:Anti-sigma-K factor rskA n=1 Tax=Gelidibacter sediminis TaxID=1608710 RepID=A0A4R7PZS5_9FLAO|nr:anti-sigma factor [Gelidibacter sediminis]TDU39640.1 anti-sigma-K factor rskA [Gelidibacter sediminis]